MQISYFLKLAIKHKISEGYMYKMNSLYLLNQLANQPSYEQSLSTIITVLMQYLC